MQKSSYLGFYMQKENIQKSMGKRLFGIFLLFFLLFNYPFLRTYDTDTTLLGIPMLYLFIFSGWLLCIFFSFLILER